ncbi:DsrE family protein [Methanobacterium oryzae]|uniref:DsrE family protein n=1 Tax=Methanobacterium oryzae TaxID=69540 RepID=UPI003D1905B0
MKKVKALGIKAPNTSIMADNILKNGSEDELIIIVNEGSEGGLENVAKKHGLKLETEKSGKETVENQGFSGNRTKGSIVVVRMSRKEMEELDVTGETCPGPIIIVGDKLGSMQTGERLKVKNKSIESIEDIAVSIADMGGKVIEKGTEGDKNYIVIEKSEIAASGSVDAVKRDKVLVVQSNGIGNAERAYATFIFSKAALSMGKEVTIFLLMDGASIARKGNAETVKHPAFDRLSKLMAEVIDKGVKVYVCELSAEFRGIKPENLVEGTKIAGAATYITLLSDPTYAIVNF